MGRPSLYEEAKAAEWLKELWLGTNGAFDVDKLREKIKSGKYTASDRAALLMLEGDQRLLSQAMNKLIPDLVGGTDTDGSIKVKVTIDQVKRFANRHASRAVKD